MFIFNLGRHIDTCVIILNGKQRKDTGTYRGNVNDWNYDSSCMLTSLPVWDLENFRCLIFVAHSVPCILASELQWETVLLD